MTNESDFTGNSVLFADILGFSKQTLEQRKQAEQKLRKFSEIFSNLVDKYDMSNISDHNFSDSVVVGFKSIKDALNFSVNLFYKTFEEEIPLRGTIGIGDFTHKPNQYNKFSYTIGSGLVLASMPEKYHIKGHTLLVVCDAYKAEETKRFGDRLIFFEDEEIHSLPREFKAYIVPWWKRSDNKRINDEIDKRTKGLDVERIIYLEKTKEHMDYFNYIDGNMGIFDFF